MSVLNSWGSYVTGAYMSLSNTGTVIKKGLLYAAEQSSLIMYDIYSLEGFEKWTKAMIANLKVLSLIPSIRGVFDKCLNTLEPQKDLYYATMVFSSTAEFVKAKENNGITTYSFTVPKKDVKGQKGPLRDANGNKVQVTDWNKVLYGIGNFFETGGFLQKYKVMSFPLLSQISSQLGSLKLFSYEGSLVRFGDVPVLSALCQKPKDFFVFFASIIGVSDCFKEHQFYSVLNLAKLVSNIGKIILISLSQILKRNNYLTTLILLDFVASNASLLSTIAKRKKDREARFENPLV